MDPTRRETKSILLVDDDRPLLDCTVRILEEFDFTVHACSDRHRALARLQEEPVDAVLSDINMPQMSGIRSLGRQTPVILVTGYAELDTAISALQKGAFDFILKPYEPLYLVNALDNAVGKDLIHFVFGEYRLNTLARERAA